MKKIGKILFAISILLITATKSFATSSVEKSSGIGDVMPFIIGGILIICVLVLAYKMDNSSENAPTIKKQKAPKTKKTKENLEKQETEVYAQENKADIPYEDDFDVTYEKDEDIEETSLYEDTEYEEDDISLFNSETTQGSSFDDIDDDISYEVDNSEEENSEDVGNLNEDEDLNYTDPVEGLDEKINSLDDLEDISENDLKKESVLEEKQEAEEFLNELNKYKEEAEVEEDDFSGFTTTAANKVVEDSAKEDLIPEDISEDEIPKEEKTVKRYTKKKALKETSAEDTFESEEQYVELPSGQMDLGFLDQMEENLKKSQEERLKATEKTPKKRGRKPKKQED